MHLLIFFHLKSNFVYIFVCLQYSIQDNGSAKFFQGALHTPNMGERVAQVSPFKIARKRYYDFYVRRTHYSVDRTFTLLFNATSDNYHTNDRMLASTYAR